MIKRVVEIGFDEFKLHRISLSVFDFNKGAIACYNKVGFKQDGILRDCMKVGTEFWSAVQMSILENEWKRHKTEERQDNAIATKNLYK
jgi:RimJ/RimL family protein N-acetyltransferase